MRRRLGILLAGVVGLCASVVVVIAAIPRVSDYSIQIVSSGSMSPAIPVGALVVAAPVRDLARPGDVILFQSPLGPSTVIHRVLDVERGAVGVDYVTKGDANSSADAWRIASDAVAGRVVVSVPYAGYALAVLRLPQTRLAIGFVIIALALPGLWSGVRSPRRFRFDSAPSQPLP